MSNRIVYEVYDGYYVPDGIDNPGYFVENNVVAWADSEQVAEEYADELRQDGECAYEVFENDYQAEFHIAEDFIRDDL